MKENRTSWAGTSLEVMAVNNQKQTTTKKNCDAQNSGERAPCEAQPSWRKQDARNKKSPTRQR